LLLLLLLVDNVEENIQSRKQDSVMNDTSGLLLVHHDPDYR